jgi:hypothetical protein
VKRAVVVGAPTRRCARRRRVSRHCNLRLRSRASNVITRANWEGAGVQPDRMVPPTRLETAQALAQAALKPKK